MVVTQPIYPCRVQEYALLPVLCKYVFLINLSVTKKMYQIRQYIVLIQVIYAIFLDQVRTCLVFSNVHTMLASNYSTIWQFHKSEE
jgi:hypothetical protein